MRVRDVCLSLIIAAVAAPVQAVVVEITDTFESDDPFDFEPAGGAVESAAAGVLTGTVLVFNSAGNEGVFGYDAIRYTLASPALAPRRVTLRFDLQTSGLLGSTNRFSVIADTPAVRNLWFDANGSIAVFNPGPGESGTIAYYADDAPLQVAMTFDSIADRWTVMLGDALVYDDALGAMTIDSLRLSLGAASSENPPDPLATVYLDNVSIRAEDFADITPTPLPIPLPAPLWGLAGGLALLAQRRRKA